MSSATEHRPQTVSPRHAAEEVTVAMPRPIGPWTPGPVPPRRPWPGPPAVALSAPPAGLGFSAAGGSPRPAVRWGWVAVGAVGLVAAIALVGAVLSSPTVTVHGTATVEGMSGYVSPGSSCTSSSDGDPVALYDATGTLVGTTSLSSSGVARASGGSYSSYADRCVYSFTLTEVDATSDHYRITVGSGNGSGVGLTREQLVDDDVHLTRG